MDQQVRAAGELDEGVPGVLVERGADDADVASWAAELSALAAAPGSGRGRLKGEGMELREYLRILKRRRWIVAGTLLAVLVACVALPACYYVHLAAGQLEMYRKRHGRLSPDRVADFLILDREFPRAMHDCIVKAGHSLHAISGTPPIFENTQNPLSFIQVPTSEPLAIAVAT